MRLNSRKMLLLAMLLMPNWPRKFLPHIATVPSEQKARLWFSPAAKATTVLPESTPDVFTATGTRLVFVLLFPNCPLVLLPQQAISPVNRSAQLCRLPAETSRNQPPGAEACPASFFPQQVNVPLFETAQVCPLRAEMLEN